MICFKTCMACMSFLFCVFAKIKRQTLIRAVGKQRERGHLANTDSGHDSRSQLQFGIAQTTDSHSQRHAAIEEGDPASTIKEGSWKGVSYLRRFPGRRWRCRCTLRHVSERARLADHLIDL